MAASLQPLGRCFLHAKVTHNHSCNAGGIHFVKKGNTCGIWAKSVSLSKDEFVANMAIAAGPR